MTTTFIAAKAPILAEIQALENEQDYLKATYGSRSTQLDKQIADKRWELRDLDRWNRIFEKE